MIGQMQRELEIDGRIVGLQRPTFIVAELGINHNGDIDLALEMVKKAKSCGVDAVKFQTYSLHKWICKSAMSGEYVYPNTGEIVPYYELFKRCSLDKRGLRSIKDACEKEGILFFSSVFDNDSVDMLCELDVSVFKIASSDLDNYPLIRYIASKKRPVFLSTGMGSLGEVEKALSVLEREENFKCVLLHCVSSYPTAYKDVNLKAINTLYGAFKVPVGYSDHTLGLAVPLAASTMACVIEKHFTLDKDMFGPDQRLSADPAEMREFVSMVHIMEEAMGDGIKRPTPKEETNRKLFRRSLVAARDIPKGTALTPDMLFIKRPGSGIRPEDIDLIIGRKVLRDIDADSVLMYADLF